MRKKEYVPKSTGDLVYKTTISAKHYKSTFFNLVVYLFIFTLWVYDIKAYYNFGRYIIGPAIAIIWVITAFIALILPAQRLEVIHSCKVFCAGYVATIFGYKFLITAVSGISAENLSAAFNQALPTASGTSILGWLQTLLWIAGVMSPVGFIGMQCKRIGQFFGTKSKNAAIREIRDFRDNEKPY